MLPIRRPIIEAYEGGEPVFAHLLEFDSRNFKKRESFFQVLAGDETATFFNSFHAIAGTKEGYVGLPLTSLQKNYPVSCYAAHSYIGLIFPRCHAQFQLLYVFGNDSDTKVDHGRMKVFGQPGDFRELRAIQELSLGQLDLNLMENRTEKSDKAHLALDRFWELVATAGWTHYVTSQKSACNESIAVAHLAAAGGIVVYDPFSSNNSNTIVEAIDLKNWLGRTYPTIAGNLPIYIYAPKEEHKLTEFSPGKSQTASLLRRGREATDRKDGVQL